MRRGDWVTTPAGVAKILDFEVRRWWAFGRPSAEAYVRVELMDGTKKSVRAADVKP